MLGVTRQAYYQHEWALLESSLEEELIVKQVLEIRKAHKRMGGRKLYELLGPFMLEHQIKMGRDALFDLLARNRLLVRKRRLRIYTTQSSHWLRTYPNLAGEFTPCAPNELWVSDITYFKKYYISFVTDAYSHKIVGYNVADNLRGLETLKALDMALRDLQKPVKHLVHHSDRGVQYCWEGYVGRLKACNISISMTQNSDPLENPVAERINGIIKEEYLDQFNINDLKQMKSALELAVNLYNDERPHLSLGMLTPSQVHNGTAKGEKLWKGRQAKVISATASEPFNEAQARAE